MVRHIPCNTPYTRISMPVSSFVAPGLIAPLHFLEERMKKWGGRRREGEEEE